MPRAKRKQNRWRWALVPLAVCLAFFSASRTALAHSMYQAAILLDYHVATVGAELQLPPSRLERLLHQPLTASTLAGLQPRIAQYVLSRVQARDGSGRPWSVRMEAPLLYTVVDGAPYVVAHLRLVPPPGHGL